MGYSPRYPKARKLIYYINRAEIVKNFTNFTCGCGEGPIRFRRSSNGRFRPRVARVFDVFTVFCCKKTIDGEGFLKRIHASQWRECSFVANRRLTKNRCQRFSQSGPIGCL
jgi:hypothetical protein